MQLDYRSNPQQLVIHTLLAVRSGLYIGVDIIYIRIPSDPQRLYYWLLISSSAYLVADTMNN